MSKGLYIVFEGNEGCGKTSLIKDYLMPKIPRAISTRAPGGTHIGETIRTLLLNSSYKLDKKTELLLFQASGAANVQKIIRPMLEAGNVVLGDRWAWSGVAYQGFGLDLDIFEIDSIISFAQDGLVPDLVVYLDVEVSTGLERARERDGKKEDVIQSRSLHYHQKVAMGFDFCFRQKYGKPKNILHVDANMNKQYVEEYVWRAISDLMASDQ